MDRSDIIALATGFINDSPGNFITEQTAIHPRCVGMRIYDPPLLAFGSADDDIFKQLKSPDIIGNHFLTPIEWLPYAQTVVSFFLPYSKEIKKANSLDCAWPADEWLHGRWTSNWSERHIAYACGLGTFGLSRGIITKRGMCGVCIERCPAQAISYEGKMNQALCGDFLDKVRNKTSPRYGCGKCQVAVPCESAIP
jgi:epoxyqueuosine reductase QueG